MTKPTPATKPPPPNAVRASLRAGKVELPTYTVKVVEHRVGARR